MFELPLGWFCLLGKLKQDFCFTFTFTAKELIPSKKQVKSAPIYPIMSQENWKVNLAEEISLIYAGLMDIDFDLEDLEEILEDICTE